MDLSTIVLEEGKRLVVGIDGLSRSGKTTFSKKLVENLRKKAIPVYVLHLDDHIEGRKKRYDTGYDPWYEYYHLQWDIEWLKVNLFEKLKWTDQISLPFYEQEDDTHAVAIINLPLSGVILIEGVFLQRKEWRDFFDYVVYLDCPKEIRFSRETESAQLDLEKFINRYWKAEDYYLKRESPTKQANLVIST
ncbi:kinase [Halobacillus ihumii]|uniref:kinase n=1 Tax=Halobacillus ihumii TaxID=2686092 RepID=UPI0013D02FCC|nr:kinase [Halobacillus ihumii]